MPTRKATAVWEKGLRDGNGRFQTESGAIEAAYSFTSRFEEGPGSNPEELLAAAHAACFSQALRVALERGGHVPERIETAAACTVERVGEGFKITRMELDVRASVPGIDESAFGEAVEGAKEGCPVSGALRNNLEIGVTARLQ